MAQHAQQTRYLRQPWLTYGICGKSKWYSLVHDGSLPPPRKLGSIALWEADETGKAVDDLLSKKGAAQ